MSESDVQAEVRLAASQRGDVLWRNNNGAGKLENGQFVRWGICNDSAALNEQVKSSDLIGITRVVVTPEMVGTVVGVFTAVEMKKPGWTYRGTKREIAQKSFLDTVTRMGGIGKFVTKVGEL